MGLVAARCTQCGANIDIDDTKEAGVCKYCGTAFITEKVININGIDTYSLLELAKKELLIHNYSNANFYLDEIKKNSADSQQKISDLFNELGVLEWAKAAWNSEPDSQETKELMKEIITYDSQNINVWFFMLETSLYPPEIVSFGNKVLMLASQDESEYYKEKVYEIYIQKAFDPKKVVSSVNLVSEIPHKFIIENDKLQSMLMENCVRFISNNRTIITCYEDRINDWCSQLQDDKRDEIQRMLKTDKGCYIATCVYGSYD